MFVGARDPSCLWVACLWVGSDSGSLTQDTLEKCGKCGEVVRDDVIRAMDKTFHPPCFTCVTCARCIGDERFALDSQNQVYCVTDFYRWERRLGLGRWGRPDRTGGQASTCTASVQEKPSSC